MSRGSTRLVIVRHGQTAANVGRLLQGSTDLPLNETGNRQAQLIARRIASEIDAQVLISSPMIRARATARPISDLTGLEIQERAALREIDFGSFEGIEADRLHVDHPEIAALALDPHDVTLQWPNGEHVADFYLRSQAAFASIASEFPRKTIVVVAHGGVIGSYLRYVAGDPLNDWRRLSVHNCSLSIVDFANGRPQVVVRNDCAHLDEWAAVEEPARS